MIMALNDNSYKIWEFQERQNILLRRTLSGMQCNQRRIRREETVQKTLLAKNEAGRSKRLYKNLS